MVGSQVTLEKGYLERTERVGPSSHRAVQAGHGRQVEVPLLDTLLGCQDPLSTRGP